MYVNMRRQVELLIDPESWCSKNLEVPDEIKILKDSFWDTEVLCSLLFTAICTRPPVTTGLHLSDFWAWLRYRPAISNRSDLRLCEEWDVVDSHQKTILSDELGVGFTTHLLADKLGFLCFADTLYVVEKLFSNSFNFQKFAKNGAKKSPDFIGFDSNNNFFVLECKGTQVSRKALKNAIDRGKKQKENLVTHDSTNIKYKLVAGLFIPMWRDPSQRKLRNQDSCIIIADPTWAELEDFFNEIPSDRIRIAIVQIALAKHLSLIGLNRTAQVLAETPTERITALPDQSRDEIYGWMRAAQNDSRVLFDTDILPVQFAPNSRRERFQATVPKDLLVDLAESQVVGNFLRDLTNLVRNRDWRWFSESDSESTVAVVITPLGFKFELEINQHL